MVKKAASSKKGSASPPPKSALSGGKYKSPILGKGKKDSRNQVWMKGMQENVAVGWLKKSNREEEAFAAYDMELLHNQPELLETLGINAILFRKGTDGATPMPQSATSSYSWRQFLCVLGEGNTPEGRRAFAMNLIDHLNNNATSEHYQYPKKYKFGGDLTATPMETVDTALLDEDVMGVMLAAYPTTSIADLVTFEDVMERFWSDIDHGREFLEQNANEEEEAEVAEGGNE